MNISIKKEKIYLDQIQKLLGHTIFGISATLINSLILSLIFLLQQTTDHQQRTV